MSVPSKPLIGTTSESSGHIISTSLVSGTVLHKARMKETVFPLEEPDVTKHDGVGMNVDVSPEPLTSTADQLAQSQ